MTAINNPYRQNITKYTNYVDDKLSNSIVIFIVTIKITIKKHLLQDLYYVSGDLITITLNRKYLFVCGIWLYILYKVVKSNKQGQYF